MRAAIVLAFAVASLLACGPATQPSDAGVDSTSDTAADARTEQSLPNPKFIVGESRSDELFCSSAIALDAARRVWIAARSCETTAVYVEGRVATSDEFAGVDAEFAKLPPDSACERGALKGGTIYFFSRYRADGTSQFWWGCETPNGALQSPYREIEQRMSALTR